MGVFHTGLSFLSGRTLEEVPARALTGACDSGREVVSPVGYVCLLLLVWEVPLRARDAISCSRREDSASTVSCPGLSSQYFNLRARGEMTQVSRVPNRRATISMGIGGDVHAKEFVEGGAKEGA